MTTSPPVRIHLSTAIVLVFAAAILLFANTRESLQPSEDFYYTQAFVTQYGWPFVASELEKVSKQDPAFRFGDLNMATSTVLHWHAESVVANVLVSALMLAFLAALCEWRIRRRAGANS